MLRSAASLQRNLRCITSRAYAVVGDTRTSHRDQLILRPRCSNTSSFKTYYNFPRKLCSSQKFFEKITRRFYCSNGALPSHQKIPLPALSPTMEMGTIISWEKKEGDKLNEGDLLAEIETDKATMGFETPDEGYLAKILVPAGTKDIPLGKLLCIIVESEGDIAAFKDYVDSGEVTPSPIGDVKPPTPSQPAQPSSVQAPAAPVPPAASVVPQQTLAPSGRIFASPLAKKLASEKGIDLLTVEGSGPSGRIRAQDVESAKTRPVTSPKVTTPKAMGAPAPIPGATYVDLPVSALKQEADRQTLLSKQTIPHYYLTVDIVMDDLLSLKNELNDSLQQQNGIELSTTDFIIKASALACIKVPEANSSWQETFIRQFKAVAVNVVISAGENNSVSPVINFAEKKGLTSISSELDKFTTMILDGSLQQQQPQLGTFTVSSLGMFGVKNVINIITPPQSCCLGVGAVQERLIPDESELGYKTANVMSVTLSCDHRVIDGAVGAQWLQHFKKMLEKPHMMLL